MPSSQRGISDAESGETTLPSPASSVKSSSNSRLSSRKSSPSVDSSSESNSRKRKSKRLSQQPEVDYRPHQEIITPFEEEPKLVLKKKKFNDYNGYDNKSSSATPEPTRKVLTVTNGKLVFNEPSASEPIIAVTGLPLDAPPSNKIKKESLWPRKKDKSQNSNNKATDSDETIQKKEQERKANLKTKINEKVQKQSSIRSTKVIKPVSKRGSVSTSTKPTPTKKQPTPSTPKKKKADTPASTTTTKSAKAQDDVKRKIKNASPKKSRKNAFGFDNPIQLAGEKRENAFDFNDVTKDNDDFCSACGEPGIFLCCETCPKSFHFACCDPPYSEDSLPEDEWHCNECAGKKSGAPKPRNTGLFGKLLNQLEYRNPVQFQLPKKIRERFEGVVTGKFGEYEDTDYKDYKPAKIHAFQQTDPDLHFDKDGNILLCSKCGTSGISSNKTNGDADKLIISCEYCPSSWHLDCLDPPLSAVKQLGTKWKCPNHIGDLLPEKRRRLKKPNIVDVDQTYGFKNNGDIEIKLEDDEDDSKLEDDESEDEIVELPRPPFFNNEDTPNGISAALPKHQQRLWDDSFTVFRVPERGIVLDFWSKLQSEREQNRQRSSEILRLCQENNELLSQLSSTEQYDKDEKETVQTLVQLKDVDLKGLVEVAARELNASTIVQNVDITKAELDELRHIKKLINLKGQDKMLEFLHST